MQNNFVGLQNGNINIIVATPTFNPPSTIYWWLTKWLNYLVNCDDLQYVFSGKSTYSLGILLPKSLLIPNHLSELTEKRIVIFKLRLTSPSFVYWDTYHHLLSHLKKPPHHHRHGLRYLKMFLITTITIVATVKLDQNWKTSPSVFAGTFPICHHFLKVAFWGIHCHHIISMEAPMCTVHNNVTAVTKRELNISGTQQLVWQQWIIEDTE